MNYKCEHEVQQLTNVLTSATIKVYWRIFLVSWRKRREYSFIIKNKAIFYMAKGDHSCKVKTTVRKTYKNDPNMTWLQLHNTISDCIITIIFIIIIIIISNSSNFIIIIIIMIIIIMMIIISTIIIVNIIYLLVLSPASSCFLESLI